jgi:hypothetical protein
MLRTILSILLSWCIAFTGFVPPAGAQVKRTYTLAVLDLAANGISESEALSLRFPPWEHHRNCRIRAVS